MKKILFQLRTLPVRSSMVGVGEVCDTGLRLSPWAVGRSDRLKIQQTANWLAERIPRRAWFALRGDASSPRRFAGLVHYLLNRLPGERYPVLPCDGALRGYRMRIDWQIHRCFVHGTWEPEVVAAVQQSVTPGMIALDIGAQSGFYTLLLSKLVGPQGNVVAFEPFPANFRVLAENVRLNGLSNVIPRQEAVSAQSGELSLTMPPGQANLLAGPLLAGEATQDVIVRAVSLDDWASASGSQINFLKMDIEGAETDVLRGAQRVLHDHRPIMVIELHGNNAGQGDHPVLSLLQQARYRVHWIEKSTQTPHILAEPAESAVAR